MSLDAMKQALAALEEIADEVFAPYDNKLGDAILALRAAIEQANEFNPDWDALAVMVEEQQRMAKRIDELEAQQKPWVKTYAGGKPNYTAPRQWQGLTDEELWELWNSHTEQPFPEWFVDFKRAYEVIAEKLKEKNT